jgi:RimJ/RimL family protein N-acetyltransferase
MELIEIKKNGTSSKPICDDTDNADLINTVMSSTSELYSSAGYVPPWIGYLAFEDNQYVGTCAFKAPPQDNRVEIAYFTFPDYEGKGVATRMAQSLVKIAFEAIPELTIAAQTLPEENASTNVLKKLGFQFAVELEHPEDGKIWEWRLRNFKKECSI